jgi:hypothetical protein
MQMRTKIIKEEITINMLNKKAGLITRITIIREMIKDNISMIKKMTHIFTKTTQKMTTTIKISTKEHTSLVIALKQITKTTLIRTQTTKRRTNSENHKSHTINIKIVKKTIPMSLKTMSTMFK